MRGCPIASPASSTIRRPRQGRTWFANARVFDGTSAPVRERASVLVEDGRIAAIAGAGEAPPEGARVIDSRAAR